MAGEWLAATANANMFTYEVAPVFSLMEHEVSLTCNQIKKRFFVTMGILRNNKTM
jgi:hypothetical protein